MRLSNSAIKTRREVPKDEASASAQLLMRAGFIHKDSAGVFVLLPLGLRVVNKIIDIIRQEMNRLGAEELLMTALQRQELWTQTGRWDDAAVDVWFKSQLKNGTDVGLGWTHEEAITELLREYVQSYRDLPRYLYQFQTKFRNETRSRSGILRTREFIMKDLYSFSRSEAEHEQFYERIKQAYLTIFDRVGLGEATYLTFASGGAFSKFSHEFQALAETGEDTIYLHRGKNIAINEEVLNDEVLRQLDLGRDELEKHQAWEVGNIFTLGARFSEPLRLLFSDEDGQEKPVFMGSYGIGPGRLMGVIVEKYHDQQGIVWPSGVTPADVQLVALGDSPAVRQAADELYDQLQAAGRAVIYDDRDLRAGEKFADADLIGVPWRVVISPKTLEQASVETKRRGTNDSQLVALSDVNDWLSQS